MNKFFLFFTLSFLAVHTATGQQDSRSTLFFNNVLGFNPAFAGHLEVPSLRAFYRDQRWELEGAPVSQVISFHLPLAKNKVGLGFHLTNEKIGAHSRKVFRASYAYHIQFGKGKLAFGLQGMALNMRTDWNELNFKDSPSLDEVFSTQTQNLWKPNFGVGSLFKTGNFFLGFSIPNLLEWESSLAADGEDRFEWQRHYYFFAGTTLSLDKDKVLFKPVFFLKNVNLFKNFTRDSKNLAIPVSVTEFDLGGSLFFFKTLQAGGSFRFSIIALDNRRSNTDSINFWLSWWMKNGFRFGAGYDVPVSALGKYEEGGFEIMLGFDLLKKPQATYPPGYYDYLGL